MDREFAIFQSDHLKIANFSPWAISPGMIHLFARAATTLDLEPRLLSSPLIASHC